jgi:hypothetical protein
LLRKCDECHDAPPRWLCVMADPHLSDVRLSGTALITVCTAGIRSPWPPDALAAYKADAAAGKDALLVCDTTEMADALNERIHHERRDAHAPTVTAARGHRIGVGDLILTRRNDPTIDLHNPNSGTGQPDSVRNGNRWRVTAIDAAGNRVAAQRLDDGARTVFENEYLREHLVVWHGISVTYSGRGQAASVRSA